MRCVLVLWIALVACQGDKPAPARQASGSSGGASGGSTSGSTAGSSATATASGGAKAGCDTVGDGVKAIWDKQVVDATDDATRAGASQMRDKAVARLQRHCRDDGWSQDAIDCIRVGSPCPGKLTPEQRDKLQADDLNKQAP